jgi:hypothetical protein
MDLTDWQRLVDPAIRTRITEGVVAEGSGSGGEAGSGPRAGAVGGTEIAGLGQGGGSSDVVVDHKPYGNGRAELMAP